MRTRIVEATNGVNWGKFLVGQLDTEWDAHSAMPGAASYRLLPQIGMAPDQMLVMDLQTCEGALFSVRRGGYAAGDLAKHQIWVCPMFEPFLAWLYRMAELPFDELPTLVEIDEAPAALAGYRRSGELVDYITEKLKDDVQGLADDPPPEPGEALEYWRTLRLVAMSVGLDIVMHLAEVATDFELDRLNALGVPE